MVVWKNQAVFTPEEVSSVLGVDVATVHRLIRTGQLGACSLRDGIGVPPNLLEEYQRQHAQWSSSSAA